MFADIIRNAREENMNGEKRESRLELWETVVKKRELLKKSSLPCLIICCFVPNKKNIKFYLYIIELNSLTLLVN